MAAKFITFDRNTPMLLPPDLKDWVGEDDLVHFVIEAIDRLPLTCFKVNDRGSGSKQHNPFMMLALLVYCYSNGIFSSRKIERASYRDVAVRYLTADTHPDHDTICKFRRENSAAISKSFVEILNLAKEMGLLKVGKVSTDGTHIKANASINKNITYKRAKELKNKLHQDVLELLAQAEQADQSSEDHQKLPQEIARKEKLLTKMDTAIENLKKKAIVEQEAAEKAYKEKVKQRQEKEAKTGKKARGAKPKEPKNAEDIALESKRTHNFTDEESQVMRKSKLNGYTQSYNAQASVDADGSYLILGTHIGQCSNDKNELPTAYASIPDEIGKPTHLLADAGYATAEHLESLAKKVDLYVSVHCEDAHKERQYDYRPPKKKDGKVKQMRDQTLLDMKSKLETDEGKSIYRLRSKTVETVFGIIKQAIGFRDFSLRGTAKIASEWELVCTSHNIKRLFNMKHAQPS